jgi:hypothetical protein
MHLLEDDAERQTLGRRAKETMQSQMGATSRTLEELKGLIGRGERLAAAKTPDQN